MGVENFSLLEAVELAVGIEEEGERFYALAAAKTEDAAMKQLFQTLREKEILHRKTFQKLYEEMAERQGTADAALYLLSPEIAAVFHGYVETAVFPVRGAAVQVIGQCESAEDVLRLGMQAEKDSILYYHELLRHSPYPEARELVERIIAEEHTHFAFLRAELDKRVKH